MPYSTDWAESAILPLRMTVGGTLFNVQLALDLLALPAVLAAALPLYVTWIRNMRGRRIVQAVGIAIVIAALAADASDRLGLFPQSTLPPNIDLTTGSPSSRLLAWGTATFPAPWLPITANGLSLYQFYENYKIAAVAFHYSAVADPKDTMIEMRSGLHDIAQGPVLISIPVTPKFLDEYKAGVRHTSYVLLLVPNGKTIDQFDTLRQAERDGIVTLEGAIGPP